MPMIPTLKPKTKENKVVKAKRVTRLFNFDILEMRKIQLKKHEIYIPFEVIDTKEKMNILKDVIQQLLKVVLANK
ncbi:hypothetical protein UACE39S_03126 [Ureibacillus acetophenoni]